MTIFDLLFDFFGDLFDLLNRPVLTFAGISASFLQIVIALLCIGWVVSFFVRTPKA